MLASPALATHPTTTTSPYFQHVTAIDQAGGTMVQLTEAQIWCNEGFTACESRWRHTGAKTGTAGNCVAGVTIRYGWFDAQGGLVGTWLNSHTNNLTACRAENFGTAALPTTGHNSSGTPPAGAVEWRTEWRRSSDMALYGEASSLPQTVLPPTPQNLGMVSTSPGGKLLSYDQGASLCFKYGWTSEDRLTECTAVMKQESSFRTKAISYIGCCFGLLQVYASVHNTTQEAMFDPDQNVAKAREIYVAAGSSWQPWEAWTGPDGDGSDGPWLQWEAKAREAAQRQRACGGCAYDSIASAPSAGSGSVTMGWTAGDCSGCVFELQRRTGASGSWGTLSGAITMEQFTDNGAADGTTYGYRVRAHRDGLSSEWSDIATVTTGDPDPNSAVADGDTVANDEDGSNSGTGESCWSLNPLTVLKCALRWAFVPGEATSSAWEDLHSNLASKPPFSIVSGVFSFVLGWVDSVKFRYEAERDNGTVAFCLDVNLPEETSIPHQTACVGENDTLGEFAAHPIAQSLRIIQAMFIIWGVSMALWRILSKAFGHGGDTKGAEPVQDDQGEDDKREAA